MQDLSSTVSYSPSFSYYASGEFENQSYNHHSVNDDVEDADFEFETSPLHEETFVHFPTFTNVDVSITVKKDDDASAAAQNIQEKFSGNCLWSQLRSPAASEIIKRSSSSPKRCRLKKFLRRSQSEGAVSSQSASKRCFLKDLMRRSQSDGGDASKTSSPSGKDKDKTALYKATNNSAGEGDKRRNSYLPYRQDLIGVFAGIRRLRC